MAPWQKKAGKPIGGRPPLPPPPPCGGLEERPPEAITKRAVRGPDPDLHPIVGDTRNVIIANILNNLSYQTTACWLHGTVVIVRMNALTSSMVKFIVRSAKDMFGSDADKLAELLREILDNEYERFWVAASYIIKELVEDGYLR